MEIDIEKFLSRFTVYNNPTPYEPRWNNLLIDRCILCGNKLKYVEGRSIFLCNGKKHNKYPFIITEKRFYEIQRKYGNHP